MPRSVVVLLVLSLLASCKSALFVQLSVAGAPQLPAVTQLHIAMTLGAKSDAIDAPRTPGGALALPVTLVLEPFADARGTLQITTQGLDAMTNVVGAGATSVVLDHDGWFQASITLTPGMTPIDSCHDGIVDGSETGIDCGGSCAACPAGGPGTPCTQDSDCTTGSCPDQFCELVSGPPSWLPATNLMAPRSALAAALGHDGAMYAFGGDNASDDGVATDEKLSVGGTWQTAPALPGAREAPAGAAGIDGTIYSMGGFEGPDEVDAFSTTTMTWTVKTPMPNDRGAACAATSADGRIFLMGGGIGSNYLDTVDIYTPGTNTWATGPTMSTQRYSGAAATALDGRIFAIGGLDASNAVVQSVDVLDPSASSPAWTAGSALSAPRTELAAALAADGRIYAVGGNNNGQVDTVEAYSKASNRWLVVASLGAKRDKLAVSVGADGRLYAIGGTIAGSTVAVVEVYGPAVQVAPTMGAAGSSAMVTGNNFAASAMVSVLFDGVSVGTGTTDATGALTAAISFVVPSSAAAGSHVVRVVDWRSQYPVTTSYLVP